MVLFWFKFANIIKNGKSEKKCKVWAYNSDTI